jgi:mRNA interferase RelE/StbE
LTWKVSYTRTSLKQLKKCPRQTARRIIERIEQIAESEDPRRQGKALTGKLKEYWRYRVGNYRVICSIQDIELVILVLKVGKRDRIYKDI